MAFLIELSFICKWKSLGRVRLFATPWIIQSMEFSRQEYWSGLPCLPLQGIFPTQDSNPGLLHYRWIFYHLSHQGSPRILEWVAYPFSRGSSQPRDWIQASHIAGRFFTVWATREILLNFKGHQNCQKNNLTKETNVKNFTWYELLYYKWYCYLY